MKMKMKTTITKTLCAILIATAITSCATKAKKQNNKEAQTEQTADPTAINGEWLISTVNGKKIQKIQKLPIIIFDTQTNKVYGTAGCNTFRGTYETNGAILTFGPLATTMMAGPGLEQETLILKTLENVRGYNHDGDVITLQDEDGEPIVTLSKKN